MRLEAIALPLVRLALTEDVGGGDATTDGIVDPEARARAHIEARATGVLAGTAVAALAFRELDPEASVTWRIPEGGDLAPGARVGDIDARARAILSAERVALNFLQRLSGIATLARAYVRAVEGTGVAILDTRKTTPGLRFLEKHAARVGGARSHRFGLFDGILVKENHIRVAGSMAAAVERARRSAGKLAVAVEVGTEAEAKEAVALGVKRLLLDNWTPKRVAAVAKLLAGCEVEVSGGIRLENVRAYAIPGVRSISVGALTHSAPALDLSLLVDPAT